MVLAGISILALVAQLANLQLRQQSRFAASAEIQQTQYLTVQAPRGEIRDRAGVPLAVNRPANAVVIRYPYYDYQKYPEYRQIQERLSGITAIPLPRILERVDARLSNLDRRLWEPVLITGDLSREQYAALVENQTDLPGVEVIVHPLRYYPQGALAAHAIGYVGAVTREDIAADPGYRNDDLIGKSGLERAYEAYLRGADGRRRIQVDYRFAPTGESGWVQEPVPGNNLTLTLDAELQRVAERALEWQIFRIQNIYNDYDRRVWSNARAGAVVVLEVKTGAVLAMASTPGFDLNVFQSPREDAIKAVLNDTPSRLWNRAIHTSYSPGSTWKMVTGSAALHYGVTTPTERVFSGSIYAPTQQREWFPGGFGYVDLRNALRQSSNIYFYEMGARLTIDRQVEWASLFGFGRPTGIDLPEEDPGFLPTRQYRDTLGEPWTLGNTTSAAIGQIFRATPLQLAQYAATLANQGTIMRPYLVQEIRSPRGDLIMRAEPRVAGRVPLSPEILKPILDGMLLVNSPAGTSDFAQWPLPGIRVAGKTGTAQVHGQDDNGLYVAFAPAEDPQIAIAVIIEQAGHGGSVSPVARAVFSHYFKVPLLKGDPAIVPAEFPTNKAELLKTLQR